MLLQCSLQLASPLESEAELNRAEPAWLWVLAARMHFPQRLKRIKEIKILNAPQNETQNADPKV